MGRILLYQQQLTLLDGAQRIWMWPSPASQAQRLPVMSWRDLSGPGKWHVHVIAHNPGGAKAGIRAGSVKGCMDGYLRTTLLPFVRSSIQLQKAIPGCRGLVLIETPGEIRGRHFDGLPHTAIVVCPRGMAPFPAVAYFYVLSSRSI